MVLERSNIIWEHIALTKTSVFLWNDRHIQKINYFRAKSRKKSWNCFLLHEHNILKRYNKYGATFELIQNWNSYILHNVGSSFIFLHRKNLAFGIETSLRQLCTDRLNFINAHQTGSSWDVRKIGKHRYQDLYYKLDCQTLPRRTFSEDLLYYKLNVDDPYYG